MPRSSAERVPTLRITEVFLSLQGETSRAGLPTVFVRLTGCPLRCQYCDTAYAFSGGEQFSCESLVAQVTAFGVLHVTVTGGEPLAQPDCLVLLKALCDAGFDVSLETSGALPIDAVDARVARILDLKTPGSGEVARNHLPNLSLLNAKDEIKFVICDRNDYEWARMTCERYGLYAGPAAVLFSPSANQLPPRTLADWIVEDRLAVRFQTQLHKSLWGDEVGR
ncbi:MAG: 7-carboxy-7-deazaguanine synthase QueE [Pseudomonadota bacterium]